MAEEKTKLNVFASVLPSYEKELTEQEERTTKNTLKVLESNMIKDELVRARILSKNKAFIRDVFNASVESGLY